MKTIYSLVTKPINQNVAIIRISGDEALEVTKSLIPEFSPVGNRVEFFKLFINKKFVDDVLVLTFVAPNSFTGENVVEIQSHGSMFVVQKILSYLHDFGLEQSLPGEFMKQAYMNGKMDLSQTEAINTLILSENEELSNRSTENLNGKQTDYINSLLLDLGKIVSNIQISIDHPESTDLPQYNLDNINKDIKSFIKNLKKIIIDSSSLIRYSKGIVISLVGIPNAGKSTLLNALVQENRAIVSDIEGTTRDIVESTVFIDGIKITFQDTAGIRNKTFDRIEREGINRSLRSIDSSDIVIFVLDGTKDIDEQRKSFPELIANNKHKIIEVISKSDLNKNDGLNISAINNDISSLLVKIKVFIKSNIFDNDKNNDSFLVTQKQIDNFNFILNSLTTASKFIDFGETSDVVAFELENSMKRLGVMLGQEIDREYMDNLFASFCVGK